MRSFALLALALLLSGCASPAATMPAATAPAPALACGPCRVLVAPASMGTREPAIAVDPTDPAHLLVASMAVDVTGVAGRLQLRVHESRDAGATWTTRALDPPAGMTETYDPTIAFLPVGTPLVAGIAVRGAYSIPGMAQGDSEALSWRGALASPVVVEQGRGVESSAWLPTDLATAALLRAFDKPALVVRPDGTALLAYSAREQAPPESPVTSRLAIARSADGGATWTPTKAPDLAWPEAMTGPGVVTAAGTWVLPYATGKDFGGMMRRDMLCGVATTRDPAQGWTPTSLGPCDSIPALARRDGALVVALTHRGLSLARSDDEGASWRPVAQDAGGEQDVPAVAVLGDGSVVATHFHDNGNGTYEYRALRVVGETVSVPLVLDAALTRTPQQLGDEFGLAAVPGGAIATWVTDAGEDTTVAAARLTSS